MHTCIIDACEAKNHATFWSCWFLFKFNYEQTLNANLDGFQPFIPDPIS